MIILFPEKTCRPGREAGAYCIIQFCQKVLIRRAMNLIHRGIWIIERQPVTVLRFASPGMIRAVRHLVKVEEAA